MDGLILSHNTTSAARFPCRPTMVEVLEELQRVQAVVCGDNADYTEDAHDGKSSSEEDANASGAKPSQENKRVGESNGDYAENGDV